MQAVAGGVAATRSGPPGPPGSALRLAGAASTAIEAVLTGTPRPGTVVAVDRHACYVDAGPGGFVVVAAAGASRMPCAVRLGPGAPPPSRWSRAGEAAVVGGREVRLARATIAVARWWSPVPPLPEIPAAALAEWYAALRALTFEHTLDRGGFAADPAGRGAVADLGAALSAADGAGAIATADRLVGRGPGSTPSGDDVLAGALVALRLLASAYPPARGLWDAAGQPLAARVTALAPSRTTPLSAVLLAHAAAGQPLGELADVIRTVAGGPVAGAAGRLLRLGHTSGADLMAGLLLAAAGVVAVSAAAGNHPRERA